MALKLKDLKEKIVKTGRVDIHDVNDVTEIGAILDALNSDLEKQIAAKGDREISEISKFLTKIETSKTFIPGLRG